MVEEGASVPGEMDGWERACVIVRCERSGERDCLKRQSWEWCLIVRCSASGGVVVLVLSPFLGSESGSMTRTNERS